jgi:hypothetical protein
MDLFPVKNHNFATKNYMNGMKTNLSSKITLTKIPKRFYQPENAYEHSVLARFEKIPTFIYPQDEDGARAVAKEVAEQIRLSRAGRSISCWRCRAGVPCAKYSPNGFGSIARNS